MATPDTAAAITDLIYRNLRIAHQAALDAGADPETLRNELAERARRIRAMSDRA